MVKRKAGSLIVMFLLLVCSVCFMALPSYAYSASESASQDVYLSAWIDGESLYILATSTAGIDAVFIDEARVNYRVDDVLVLSLKEHTDKESLKVYAIDFNGNRSATQTLQNPLYQAPKSTAWPVPPLNPKHLRSVVCPWWPVLLPVPPQPPKQRALSHSPKAARDQ